MTEVLIYARLSVSKEESVSIERQLEAGRQYAAARGWTVAGEFTDDGVSATKNKPEDRVGWRAVLDAAQGTHAVIVWKVDRLARSVLDFLNADRALQERGSGIVCVADPIDMTTPQGRAFATVLAVFAELEAAGIAARVKDARHALLKVGRRAGGRPPYGFRNVPNPHPGGKGKVLAHDPATIEYVKEAADRALRGDSLYSITRWLDESGAPRRKRNHKGKPRSTHWAEASVESILRNPALAGLVPFKPNRKPGEESGPWDVLHDEDGVAVVDESLQIISIEERRRLLALLDAAKRPGSRAQHTASPALLSRLLRCGTCGGPLHRTRAASKYLVFACRNRDCAARASVTESRIEGHIIAATLAERGKTRLHEFREYRPDSTALAAIEQALSEAGAAYAHALGVTKDKAEAARLQERIASLSARHEEASSAGTAVPTVKPVVAPIRGQQTWGEEFTEALAEDRLRAAALLREQVTSITVHPTGQHRHAPIAERLDIDWVPVGDAA